MFKIRANANLEILAVEYFNLIPEFDKNITNYSVEISNEVDKLNIFVVSSDETAKVEISGNEDLKIGDNQIIISVTAKDEITTKKYYINAHRRSNEEEIQYEEEKQNTIEEANVVLEQMNNEKNEEEEYKENNEDNQEETKIVGNIITLIGSILSIIVLGIVVVRIKRNL